MEIEYHGANCFNIKTKKANIVIDDNLNAIGGKSILKEKITAFYSNESLKEKKIVSELVIASPGEFEIGDVTVTGIQARAHIDEEGSETAIVFQFMNDNQSITVLGHVHPDLSPEVVELISGTDVLILPVGGNGYTLDPTGATSVIKSLEPGVVIPSQYYTKGLNFEVPAQELEEFGKVSSLSLEDKQDVFKFIKNDEVSTLQTRVVVLNISK